MIKKDWCGCLCGEREVIYHLYWFRGHVFREYADGRVMPADKDDVDFVKRIRGEA